jgi:transposase
MWRWSRPACIGFRSIRSLETRGFQVFLVNAQHVKNGLPMDSVSAFGGIAEGQLLAAGRDRCARSLWRHRESLVQMAAEPTQHMQKALSQMNLQLHHVLSEITGLSGLAILDALLAGERDPVKLARLCNGRVKSPREEVAKSLEGDYRTEHLFALRQSLVGYRFYQKLIAEVDVELQLKMRELPGAKGAPEQMPPRTKTRFYQRAGNEPALI